MAHDPFREQLEVDRLLRQGIEAVEGTNQISDGNPICVVDLGEVKARYQLWTQHFPHVAPFYAVKCNSDLKVLEWLLRLGAGINCNTLAELEYVLGLGFDAKKITLTHPFKSQTLLHTARLRGVSMLSFDTIEELDAIQKSFPEAELLLRIATYETVYGKRTPSHFGITTEDIEDYLKAAKQRDLKVVGVSFHSEAGGDPTQSFQSGIIQAIETIPHIIKMAIALGFHPRIVDIGGGFIGQSFPKVAGAIAEALARTLPPGFTIIGEPGRFMVDSSTTIACKVLGIRGCSRGRSNIPAVICINSSVFEDFAMFVTDYVEPYVEPFKVHSRYLTWKERGQKSGEGRNYMVAGYSLFEADEFVKIIRVHHDINVGDWICFRHMGAYSNPPSAAVGGGESRTMKLYHITE
ncbi:hypothetical protein K469DRAFT_558462 [Zopfia rhizophila CBS 207.26]|uniref:ornithine decarboxylase n=1 Tax=Zopfia rhizophila CBS 207.26 TaxID=1314779 RepID=A0A6A6EKC7_9PEZI|nr:hypothetical protein K469DRAFT_558462 [Zopfia rhizophila CBS 207.26]